MLEQGKALPSASNEWRKGWKLVVASCAGATLTPLSVYTMGLFVTPLEKTFGWSRTVITSGLTIYAVIGVIFAAVAGALVDRYGPRRIAIPGVVLYCVAFAALATATPSKVHWWGVWLLISIAAVLVKPTVWSAAIISRFNVARGTALALALCGVGVCGVLAPIVSGYLIDHYGWRWAYFGIGAIWMGVSLPLIVAFFYGEQDLHRRSGGYRSEARADLRPGANVGDAVRSAAFLKLALASFLVMAAVTAGLVHFVPIVTARGIDRSTAIGLASIIGFSALVGRIITGTLLDRLNARIVGAVVFALPAIAYAALLVPHSSLGLAALIAIIFGFCSGAELQVSSYLASRHFGTRNFGTLFGLIMGLISFATGMGPMLASFAFDEFGTYELALMLAIPSSIVAAGLIFALGDYADTDGLSQRSAS